jgi:hypothetical protein
MIRPPSNQKPYDLFFSGDEAIVQLPANATDEQKATHARLLKTARETGDWRPVLVEGKAPTKFVMKPMPGTVYRTLMDMVMLNEVGPSMVPQLAFRICITEITGLGIDFELKHVASSKLGTLASTEVTDLLDGADLRIVTELGNEVLRRAREVSPKS